MPLVTPYGTLHNMYHKTAPEGVIYIGRGKDCIFGNPFTHLSAGKTENITLAPHVAPTRERAVALFSDYASQRITNDEGFRTAVKGLYGKHLVCFCFPLQCHGEILLQLTAELNDAVSDEAWEKIGTD